MTEKEEKQLTEFLMKIQAEHEQQMTILSDKISELLHEQKETNKLFQNLQEDYKQLQKEHLEYAQQTEQKISSIINKLKN